MNELFIRRNLIAFILKMTGLVIIGWGVIAGFLVLSEYNSDYGYVPLLAITTVFTPFVVGILFIGFGELIDLVQKIAEGKQVTSPPNEESVPIAPTSTIPFYAEQELKAFYSNQNEEVHLIESTTERDVFKVTVKERTEYVEIGGFKPNILTKEEAIRFS